MTIHLQAATCHLFTSILLSVQPSQSRSFCVRDMRAPPRANEKEMRVRVVMNGEMHNGSRDWKPLIGHSTTPRRVVFQKCGVRSPRTGFVGDVKR